MILKRYFYDQQKPNTQRRRTMARFLRLHFTELLLVAGITMLLTGCPKTPPLPPPAPIPGTESAELTTEEVSQIVDDRMKSFQSLKGMGKIHIQTWEEKYKFSENFILEQPTRFRLETLGFLDQPVIFLTSNEAILSLYSKKQNVNYRGIATRENLFKLSGINLSVEDAILVLSGNPPQISPINSEWGIPLPEGSLYYLERVSLNLNTIQRIWFDTQGYTIARLQEYMLTNGELTLDVTFEDYRAEEDSYPIPARILIDRPFDKTRVEIKYKELYDINHPIDQELFTFIPPETAEIRFIDDATDEELEHLAPYEDFRTEEDLRAEEE